MCPLSPGSANTHVILDFSFALRTKSDANVAFPAVEGDEVPIRFGKNDTQQNGFTAGQYPGPGGRNIFEDGHELSVNLTTTPVP